MLDYSSIKKWGPIDDLRALSWAYRDLRNKILNRQYIQDYKSIKNTPKPLINLLCSFDRKIKGVEILKPEAKELFFKIKRELDIEYYLESLLIKSTKREAYTRFLSCEYCNFGLQRHDKDSKFYISFKDFIKLGLVKRYNNPYDDSRELTKRESWNLPRNESGQYPIEYQMPKKRKYTQRRQLTV